MCLRYEEGGEEKRKPVVLRGEDQLFREERRRGDHLFCEEKRDELFCEERKALSIK